MSAEQICATGFAAFLLAIGIAVVIASIKGKKGDEE